MAPSTLSDSSGRGLGHGRERCRQGVNLVYGFCILLSLCVAFCKDTLATRLLVFLPEGVGGTPGSFKM